MEGNFREKQERRAELEKQVKALMALDPVPVQCEAIGQGSTDSQADTGRKGDLGAAAAHVGAGDSMEASGSYRYVAQQSSSGAEQGAPAAGSLPRVADT